MEENSREKMHTLLSEHFREEEAEHKHGEDKLNSDSALLTSYIVLGEWYALDGSKWTTVIGGDSTGQELPHWTALGLLVNTIDVIRYSESVRPDYDDDDE